MAQTIETVQVRRRFRQYQWPEAQLNFWLLVMFAAAATELGVFVYFMTVQAQVRVPSPWSVNQYKSRPESPGAQCCG